VTVIITLMCRERYVGSPSSYDRHQDLACVVTVLQVAQQRYDAVLRGQPERLVSGSDDHTMFLWTPSTSKTHVARMTGHVQLINQVGSRFYLCGGCTHSGQQLFSTFCDPDCLTIDAWASQERYSLFPLRSAKWRSYSSMLYCMHTYCRRLVKGRDATRFECMW
jgi:hypothetical protein